MQEKISFAEAEQKWNPAVLSGLKQHLGKKSDFCYPSPKKQCEREASTHELSLLRSIHN